MEGFVYGFRRCDNGMCLSFTLAKVMFKSGAGAWWINRGTRPSAHRPDRVARLCHVLISGLALGAFPDPGRVSDMVRLLNNNSA